MQEQIVADAEESSEERKKIVRRLAHAMWLAQWSVDNPKAGAEARKAGWKAARGDAIKGARKVLRLVEKKGVALTLTGADPETDEG